MNADDDSFCSCSENPFRNLPEETAGDPSIKTQNTICTCSTHIPHFHDDKNQQEPSVKGGSIRTNATRCTCSTHVPSYREASLPDGSVKGDSIKEQTTKPMRCFCNPTSVEGSLKDDVIKDSLKKGALKPCACSPNHSSTGGSTLKEPSKGGSIKESSLKSGATRCTCSSHGASIQPTERSKGDSIKEVSIKSGATRCTCSSHIASYQSTEPSKGDSVKEDSIKKGKLKCGCNIEDGKGSSKGGSIKEGPPPLQPILDEHCDPDHPKMLTYELVRDARANIEGAIIKTPLTKSRLSDLYGMNIYLKTDFLQYTGSFKERGARNALMNMPENQKSIGAISASAGNHALALCYHGQELGIPVTVVMPAIAPIMKIQNCMSFGAEVLVKGADLAEAKLIAQHLAQERGALYINGFDHIDVLAGQGTLGVEILEQLPSATAVIVPAGGGGLIAGVAVAIKTLKPCTKVIGVESENCPGFSNSLKVGKPVLTTSLPTLADGLAVSLPGFNAVYTAKNYVDKMVVVKEDDIAVAMLRLIEKEKYVVEGAGATSIAAIASGQLDEFKGKNVVAILSGGNVDSTVLGRVLERGLAADGRFLKVYVTVSDRPGGVSELIRVISSIGVSIKFITQERRWLIVDVFSVMVKVVCETRDWEHALELKHLLEEHYDSVRVVHVDFPPSTISGKLEI